MVFSFHEIGLYDLPAVSQYIKDLKNNSIIFIGQSMGTNIFYVFASEKPKIASENVKAMLSLAPTVFMGDVKSPLFQLASNFVEIFQVYFLMLFCVLIRHIWLIF